MRNELFYEHIFVTGLLHRRKRHYLSFLKIPVYSDAADHSLHSHILGRQAGQIHHRSHRNWEPGQHRHIRSRTDLDKPDFIPYLPDALVPTRSVAGRLEAIVRGFPS